MSDKARADIEGIPPADESQEHESWLREAARAPQAARLPRRGDLIGSKYRIEDLLGRGGMGVVFRARHVVSEKPVAIKWMLRPATDEQAQRRFEREARAAGRIDHPNVVSLFDIGAEGDCSYLVMELLRGESLRTRLGRGALEPTEAVDTLIPAMRGVAAAHRAGVIHRDLKPDNIFLCQQSDGGPGVAKVLDFGVSSIASLDAADPTLTQEGTLLGSLAYMSPEQLRSAHEVDARTDVYAFGVILYELLAGGLPFRGVSHSALIVAIATTQPKRLSQLRPNIPSGLEDVVFRALARDCADRYPEVTSLIEALLPFATFARPSGGLAANAVGGLQPGAPQPGSSPPALNASTVTTGTTGAMVPALPVDIAGVRARVGLRSRVVLAGATLILIAALWAVMGSWRGPDAPEPIGPSVRATRRDAPTLARDVPESAPALPATAPTPTATPPVQTAAPQTPDRPIRARASRSNAVPHSASAPDKSTIDTKENALFSGRK